jgi:hypothetical protein
MKYKILKIFLIILFYNFKLQAQMPKHFTLKFINQREVKIQFLSKVEREKLIKKFNGSTDLPKELISHFEKKLGYRYGVPTPTIQSMDEFEKEAIELVSPLTEEQINQQKEWLKDPYNKKVFFLNNKQIIKTHLPYNQKEEIYILFNSFDDFKFASEFSHIYYIDKKLEISTFWREKADFDNLLKVKEAKPLADFSNKHYKSYALNDETFVYVHNNNISNNSTSSLFFNLNDLKKSFIAMNRDNAKYYQVNVENQIIIKKLFITRDEVREVSLIPYQKIDSLKINRNAKKNQELSDKMRNDDLYDLDNEDVLIISGVGFNNFGILMKKADFIKYLPNSNWGNLTKEDLEPKVPSSYDKFFEYGEDFPKYTHILIQDLLAFLKINKNQSLNKDLWWLIWDKLEEYLSNEILFDIVAPGLIALDGEIQIAQDSNYHWVVYKRSIKPKIIKKDGKVAYLEIPPYEFRPYVTINGEYWEFRVSILESIYELGWGYIDRDYEDD